jgi:hypothetical protein
MEHFDPFGVVSGPPCEGIILEIMCQEWHVWDGISPEVSNWPMEHICK